MVLMRSSSRATTRTCLNMWRPASSAEPSRVASREVPARSPRSGRSRQPAAGMALPPFFHYANALKYLASAAAAVAILNGNRAEAMTLQWSVLVLIGFKWLAVAAGLGGRAVP